MRWLSEHACRGGELRFDVAAVRMRGTVRRDRGARSRVLRSPAAAGLAVPAAGVPVSACRRVVERDDDLVALTGRDLVVAARAAVRLHRLVRMDVADLELVEGRPRLAHQWASRQPPKKAQTTSAAITTNANDHDDDVGATIDAAAERVEPHGPTVSGKSEGAATRAVVMLGAWSR